MFQDDILQETFLVDITWFIEILSDLLKLYNQQQRCRQRITYCHKTYSYSSI